MAVTLEEFNEWKARGTAMGATHLISVCDTWDYEDYPVFVMPTEKLDDKVAKASTNMQRVNEVVVLDLLVDTSVEEQDWLG